MNQPITWAQYLEMNFGVPAILIVLLLALLLVSLIVKLFRAWLDDLHINDESESNAPQPGKTLGL
jgi:hypothetical protein